MTNEEAIKEIKYVKDKTGYADKALDMAITALKMVEIWDGCHGQIIAPRGTFEEIYNDVEDDTVGKLISVDVLDKIQAEIDRQEKWLLQAGCTAYNVDIAFDAIKSVVGRGDVE